MKATLTAAVAALVLFASPVLAQETGTAGENSKAVIEAMSKVTAAQDFVTFAAMSDMFEIKTGEMAKKQAGSDATRKLGQMLVKDHSASSKKLMKLAKAAKLEVSPPAAFDQRHQVIFDSLKDAKGEAFDKAFAEAQVQAHEEGIALFQAYAQNGDNEQLKDFASKGLPKLKKHLEMAQKAETPATTQ